MESVINLRESHDMPSPFSLPQTGIDALLKDHTKLDDLKGKRVGLLANQSSLTSGFGPTAYALQDRLGSSLMCLFSPEHGWSAFAAAGEDIQNAKEPHTHLPVYSLYGPLFKENLPRLTSLDVLIIDLQDVGIRCYTYSATCAKILDYVAAQKCPLDIIVCDRPNPLGETARGPYSATEKRSLVNYIPVPFQHGQTMAALLQHHNRSLETPCALSFFPCLSPFRPFENAWIPPSPGLPDWEAILLYPGLVLLEGTNVSEGRGSSLPFKCVAAPSLDFMKLVEGLNEIPQSGIKARPFTFVPESGKLSGQLCHGAQIHVTDATQVKGLYLGIYVLHTLFHSYPGFEWDHTQSTYWIDELMGSSYLREAIEKGKSPEDIYGEWE
jgi:uncharacterized protein YbbC (DUF1343 family)